MRKTVLIVEDEFLIAMDLQLLLEGNDWRVIGPAPNVSEALALLTIELPSTALLDINLGNELVTPVAKALKDAGIPFAIASAYARPEQFGGDILADAPNVGKPFDEAKLLATLAQLVDR